MKQLFFHTLLFVSLLANIPEAICQRPGNFGGGGGGGGFPGIGGGGFSGGGGSGGGSGSQRLTLDTSDIFFFYAEEPNLVFPFSDSLLGDLEQYDPIRRQAIDFAHLGNLGSAHRPLFFQPTWRRGFDVGQHQFDLYRMQTSDIRYYKIEQAHTHATYTQGPTQNDGQLGVRFSRNFSDGINLSLEHRRINNLGSFDFQTAFSSALAAGLWLHHKNERYDGYFSFVSNAIQQENNGGIAEDPDNGALDDPFEVDIRLHSALTRHADQEVAYTHYLRFGDKKFRLKKAPTAAPDSLRLPKRLPSDTLGAGKNIPERGKKTGAPPVPADTLRAGKTIPERGAKPAAPPEGRPPQSFPPGVLPFGEKPGRSFTFYHQIAWQSASYKFSDASPDSAYYRSFYADSRGLRHFLEAKKLQNTFKLQTFKLRQEAGKQVESDLLEVGLLHALHLVRQEPRDTSALHDLFLTGRFNFAPGERMRIRTYAHLGVGNRAGDYRASGELFLNFKKIGNLRLEAVSQLYSPTLIQHRFFVTERLLWNHDFKRTLETNLSGTYELPQSHLALTGQYHLVNNYIYFDSLATPRQSGAFSVLQLLLRKDFHVRFVHSENWVGIQEVTDNVLRLPRIYSKHSLYLEGKIFKKVMLARIGLDARFCGSYTAPGYHPLTGQFFLQNGSGDLPFTPLLDGFMSFKVKTFRFFFKIENVLTYPFQSYYYQTADSPLAFGFGNGGIRMGISWRLVD